MINDYGNPVEAHGTYTLIRFSIEITIPSYRKVSGVLLHLRPFASILRPFASLLDPFRSI